MPAIAMHSRSPSNFDSQTQQPASMSPTTGESGKKRLGFLRHLKPHRAHSNDVSPKVADFEPTSPSPMHRATAPVESDSRSRLAAPFMKGRSRSVSPMSAETPRQSKDVSRYDSGQSQGQRPSMNSQRPMSNGSTLSKSSSFTSDSRAQSPSEKRSVKFAAGVEEEQSQRPRRFSNSSAARRKSSIYVKLSEGDGYVEGVDQGAGSKARRLSVQLPSELYVDECRLEEYFDLMSRIGKKKIGEGGAASVQLMRSKKAGEGHRVFAVKEFRPWDSEEEAEIDYKRKIKSEYAIAKSCEHPNIVQTFRLCCSGDEWFHVMEYCDLGDLNDLINKNYMSQEDRNCMFKQLIRGIEYLHARGLSHRDIKSENLLVNHHGCLKIADFGTSEVFCGEHPGARNCRRPSIIDDSTQEIRFCAPGMIGSRPYMAPEVVDRKKSYDPRKVDIWSAAIVYLSLCFTGTPWESADAGTKNYNIYCNSWEEFMERHPDGKIEIEGPLPNVAFSKMLPLTTPNAKAMAMGMLHPDPSMRWTAKQVLDLISNKEGYGPWPCCQQDGYSDDIKARERKARHNHIPPDKRKKNGEFSGKT